MATDYKIVVVPDTGGTRCITTICTSSVLVTSSCARAVLNTSSCTRGVKVKCFYVHNW